VSEEFVGEIVHEVLRIKYAGDEPDTLVMPKGAFPLRVRVKGTSKQRKRARFINRKVGAELEALMAWYGLTPPAPSCAN
jgi:hypothetical protein